MNIYVGNLSFEVTEDELKEAFEAFGHVDSVKVIKDMYTSRSRGFGFVEMPSDSEATAAIDDLDGKELKGRTLKVSKARPRNQERKDGQRGGWR